MANTKLTPLPEGFKVTKCPPTSAPENRFKAQATFNGKQVKQRSEYSLLKEEERAIELGFCGRVDMIKQTQANSNPERQAERYREAFEAARAGGATVSAALDAANATVYKK